MNRKQIKELSKSLSKQGISIVSVKDGKSHPIAELKKDNKVIHYPLSNSPSDNYWIAQVTRKTKRIFAGA